MEARLHDPSPIILVLAEAVDYARHLHTVKAFQGAY